MIRLDITVKPQIKFHNNNTDINILLPDCVAFHRVNTDMFNQVRAYAINTSPWLEYLLARHSSLSMLSKLLILNNHFYLYQHIKDSRMCFALLSI